LTKCTSASEEGLHRLRPVALEPLPAPLWTLVLQRIALGLAGMLVIGITAMFVLLALLPRTGLYATYSVMSGSMEPAIRTGAIVLVAPEDPTNIHVGDVVAVTSDQPPYPSITHRVTRIIQTSHGPEFKTKGDANLLEDPWQFGYNGPAGKVRLAIPLLGYALAFSGSAAARLGLAGCIALLLVGFFLPAIWRSTAGKQASTGQIPRVDGLRLSH
jgi:signal peptidase I